MLAEIEVYKREKREILSKHMGEMQEQLRERRLSSSSSPKKYVHEARRIRAARPQNWTQDFCNIPVLIERHAITNSSNLPRWARWCCDAVCTEYGIELEELTRISNNNSLVLTRRVAMFLMVKVLGASYPKVGKCLGGMHHTTVMAGVRAVELRRLVDPLLNKRMVRAEFEVRLHLGVAA